MPERYGPSNNQSHRAHVRLEVRGVSNYLFPMRTILLILGWLGVIGALSRGAIAAYAFWLVNSSDAEATLSAGDHLTQNLPWLAWVIDAANALLPATWVDSALNLPATTFFSVSALLAALFAWICFSGAKAISR